MQCKFCVVFPLNMVIFICIGFISNITFSCVQMERGCHGLERTAVAKFPTKKYSDKFFSAAENSQYVHLSISVKKISQSNLFMK